MTKAKKERKTVLINRFLRSKKTGEPMQWAELQEMIVLFNERMDEIRQTDSVFTLENIKNDFFEKLCEKMA